MGYSAVVAHTIVQHERWVAIRTVKTPGNPYTDPDVETGDNVDALRALGTFSLQKRDQGDRAFTRLVFTARGLDPLGMIHKPDNNTLSIASMFLFEVVRFRDSTTLDRLETITSLNNNVIVSRSNTRDLSRGHEYAMHLTTVAGISTGNDFVLLATLI